MKYSIIRVALIIAAATTIFSSCKKSDDNDSKPDYKCTTCATTPDALPANDGSSKGVYKGIVIGSSGTIKFSVLNGSNDITATMVIDGTTVILTSSIEWIDGESYVAPFTGMLNGQPVSITFSVKQDGTDPVITSANIPGHPNAVFTLTKETSNALIECFEGQYNSTKPESGTFNILLSRQLGKWGGITRENGSNEESDAHGTIDNGVIKDEKGRNIGTLNGDVISGTFQDSKGATVTISGQRTL